MSRTARLLELLIKLQTRSHFTVQEMASGFAVSRRTMLRDLQALSAMGVPLYATPGPHGGYTLLPGRRLLPLSLTMDEALGILLSYESFLRYPQTPFAAATLPAATKLRAALPPQLLHDLDRLRGHVAIIEQQRRYEAPWLGELLRAALDAAHLRIVYDSRAGVSERVIFPFGLFAMQGYWYCACFDYKREMHLSLRADRVLSLAREDGLERPAHIPVADWLGFVERDDGRGLRLRATVTERGMKSFDLQALFGDITHTEGGGVIDATVPESEIEWYAAQLLALGPEIVIESPAPLIAALRRKAAELLTLYPA